MEEPAVGGGGDVKGQPTFLASRDRLDVQQNQFRLSGKERRNTGMESQLSRTRAYWFAFIAIGALIPDVLQLNGRHPYCVLILIK